MSAGVKLTSLGRVCSCQLKTLFLSQNGTRSLSAGSRVLSAKGGGVNMTTGVPYDTHHLHKALVSAGFTDSQAEVINEQLKSVVKNSTQTYEEHFTQLDNLSEELSRKVARIEQLEKEVALLEKGTVQVLRSENQKLGTEINAFHGILKEDLQKIRNDLQLDFNLHKSWTKSALTELDKEVSRLSNQIEIKAADLGAQLDRSKMENLKYQIGLMFSCIGIIISVAFAWWRIFSK